MIASIPSEAVEYTGPVERGSYVYFLLKDGVCVYVGETTNLKKRLAKHVSEGRKEWDQVFYIFVPDDARKRTERRWINTLHPKLNTRGFGKTPMFAMRADPEAVERWRIAARKRGETLSDFMRMAAEERAGVAS